MKSLTTAGRNDRGCNEVNGTRARWVAIPARDGQGLSSLMDPRFERAPFFVLVDLRSGRVNTLPNAAVMEVHGNGATASPLFGERGVGAVVVRRCGPKVAQRLDPLGIEIWTSSVGTTVGQVLQQLLAGALNRVRLRTTSLAGRTAPARL